MKLFWENEMNFSPLSLQEYIFHFYNELVVSIVTKFKQRAKQKNSGRGSAYALCPTPSDRLTFITLLVISCSSLFANSSYSSGSCGGGGGGGGGARGEDGPGIDLPDIFCSLGSLIAEGRLPR